MIRIKTSAIKINRFWTRTPVYRGRIHVYDGKQKVSTNTIHIDRLSREAALKDAEAASHDFFIQSSGVDL